MTAFDERLRQAVAEAQQTQRESFGEEALLSLAVVPLWTSAIPGPHGLHRLSERVEDWVARLEAAGLCESREVAGPGDGTQLVFEMTASARADVLAAADPLEAARVAALIADVVHPAPEFVPRPLRRWAELAHSDPYVMGDALSERANAAINARDVATALDWITVGEVLAPVFGGDVGSAVARARRRVSLLYRAQQDERLLAGFVRRKDQIAAVERLLSGPDEEWALHLVGLGGSGKTMLIRYAGTLLARERALDGLVVARVDFDYIDPRFPFEQPAELLVRLCDGLAMYVEDREQEELLEQFVRAKRDADEALGGQGGDPEQRIMDAPMQRLLDAWAEFVASLGRRVLLILDTCEELAKLHAGEEAVPSVEAMWLLMTETQGRLPWVRVLLAGRRLLASADVEGPYDLLPGLVASFAQREYLRTFEIRGFDRAEAVELLGDAEPALVEAILAGARELGRSPGVRGGEEGPARDRYNPFDLNLYAAWLRENPELTAEDVSRADADAYVEARIVARLHDDGVDAALPAVATLGRFDLAMLEPVLPPGVDVQRVLAVLSEQEWVDVSGGHTPETVIVTVEPHLLPRLDRYCAKQRPEHRDAARMQARLTMQRLLAEAPLDPLGIERADLALRLSEPLAAARTWARLERRIVEERAWEWAAGACTRLLADEEDAETGATRPRHEALRAHLLATLISARSHRSPEPPFDPDWWQVLRRASDHPDSDIATWLVARATAQVDSRPGVRSEESVDQLRHNARELVEASARTSEVEWRLEQLAATELAALERRADADPETPLSPEDMTRLLTMAARPRGVIGIAAAVLYDRAGGSAYDNWSELRQEAQLTAEGSWLDWAPPASLPDRIALEWTLHAREPVPDCEVTAVRTVDQERLASAAILRSVARGDVPGNLETLLASAGDQPYAPECLAHRRVPPLFIAVARAHGLAGDPLGALDLLRGRRRRYESRRGADEVHADAARAARREIVAVLRRLRMADSSLAAAAADEAADVAAAQLLVTGSPAASVDDLDAHARWRLTLTPPDAATVRRLQAAATAPDADPVTVQHLLADIEEARQLAPTAVVDDPHLPVALNVAPGSADPAFEYGWLRVNLRRVALGGSTYRVDEAIPPRRLAEIALEEGELLALRLPGRASWLLSLAHERFTAAADRPGALIAATALAGAAFREGDMVRGRSLLHDLVEPAYQDVDELPPWDRLAPGGDTVFAGPWAGWLLRIHAYRCWAAGDLRSLGDAPELRAPGDALAIKPAEPHDPSLVPTLAGVVAIVAVLAAAALIFHTGAVLTAVATGLAGVLGNLALERWGLSGAFSRLRFDVTEDSGSAGFVRVRGTQKLRGLGVRLRREEAVFRLDQPTDGGKNEAVMTTFAERRLRKGRLNPVIDLRVQSALSAHPWEQRLLKFAADGGWRPRWAPNAVRTMDRGLRPERPLTDVVAIVAPARWILLASRPWIGGPTFRSGFADGQFPRVAVVVGTGVNTPGGPRVQLDAERLASASEATVSAATGAAEQLLDPEAVRAAHPDVVVLLGAPGLPDPASTFALRWFGSVLAFDAARAVLIVPALPADVAAAVLDVLAAAWPLEGRAPRKAARRVRHVIYDGLSGVPGATPGATALDVTLFLRR